MCPIWETKKIGKDKYKSVTIFSSSRVKRKKGGKVWIGHKINTKYKLTMKFVYHVSDRILDVVVNINAERIHKNNV